MQIIAFKSQKTSKKMEFFGIANNFELSSLILDFKSCLKMAVVLKINFRKSQPFFTYTSVLSKYVCFFSKFASELRSNDKKLWSQTVMIASLDIYEQNETEFVFLHTVLS